jgi:hypothetical protein
METLPSDAALGSEDTNDSQPEPTSWNWNRVVASPVWMASVVYAFSRLITLLTAEAVTWVQPNASVSQLLNAWDGGWYQWIAQEGYPDFLGNEPGVALGNRWAFAPGLPYGIRAIHEVTHLSYAASGFLLVTAAGLCAAIGIAVLVNDRLGPDTALTTTTLICFYPAAYVLSMVYTEAVFLALAVWCLWAINRGHWVFAGVLASLACLVRVPGNVLVVTVVVSAIVAARRTSSLRPLWAVLIAPIGQIVWMLIQWRAVGSPNASYDQQSLWYNRFDWFRTPFRSLWQVSTDRAAWSDSQAVMAAGGLVFVSISAVLAVRFALRNRGVVPLEWWVYSAGVVLFALAAFWPHSILRYTLVVFPLYAVAWHNAPRWLTVPGLAFCGAAMGAIGFAAFFGAVSPFQAPFAP